MDTTQKTCSKCAQVKPVSAFYADRAGRTRSACRDCACADARERLRRMKLAHPARYQRHRKLKRETRARNKVPEKLRKKQRVDALREMVNKLKAVPCVDCGCLYPPHVMQFDHVDPSNKRMSVSEMVSKWVATPAAVLAEAAKCEVVCANCHAERTHQRRLATR